jgi:hypothetical protein
MVGALKGLAQDAIVAAQSTCTIDVEGSAEARGEVADGDIFGEELVILVRKVIHPFLMERYAAIKYGATLLW